MHMVTRTNDSYLLGTHDAEIQRLGLQHRVWRARMLDAWRRARFNLGHTLLDVGCGPGYATLDMAELVGRDGRVFAFDQSRRFVTVLEEACRQRDIENVTTRVVDLETDSLEITGADGAWCRWVLAFLENPRGLIQRIAAALRPGGRFVCHEYFDYLTWRLSPPCPELEEFASLVAALWRDSGGEPDVALSVPGWLREAGFTVQVHRPIIDIVTRTDPVWEWPASFVEVGLQRLVELGRVPEARAHEISAAFNACEAQEGTLMITPGVMEIVAVKGSGD